jgi:probable phosphoglycerate mutase
VPEHSPDKPVWLVRHGETEWTLSRQHTSRTDVDLTAHGEEQARALGGVLGGRDFALVLTSPRLRARRTAELAGYPDAEADELLTEVDYGEYEGLTTAQIRETRPDWDLWRDGNPGGETVDDAGARADRLIPRLREASGPVLIFGHGHMSRVLGARLVGLAPAAGRLLLLDPGGVSIVGSEHGHAAIKRWNWAPAP